MPETLPPVPGPEKDDDWDGLAWLVPVLGEANVRRLLDNPPTEAQRRRVREIIGDR